MFETQKDTIAKARKNYFGFDKEAFVKMTTKTITDALVNDVRIPVVAEVKRLSIEANISTSESIKRVVQAQLEDRIKRNKGKFEAIYEQMDAEFEGVRVQVREMKEALAVTFAYGSKCSQIGNDCFGAIEQTMLEFEAFSALMPYKDVIFKLEMRVGKCSYRKGGQE